MSFLKRIFVLLAVLGVTSLSASFMVRANDVGKKGLSRIAVEVVDKKGAPVEGAILFLFKDHGLKSALGKKSYEMRTVDKEFDPSFLNIIVGSKVTFPNSDTVHHHVYSFSKVKKFSTRLYKKAKKSETITFENPGVVKVGCNIHDWMQGAILIRPTEHQAETDAGGKAVLEVPLSGDVELAVFHPLMRGKLEKNVQTVNVKDGKGSGRWTLTLKKKAKKPKKRKEKKYY